MRAANVLLAATLGLASCQKPNPDFSYAIRSQDGKRAVILNGFQPRGTIEGYLVLAFEANNQRGDAVATIHHITNGVVGWTSDGKVAVIGNGLGYRGISSDYTPDGTVDSEVRLVTCSRDEMDCSSLEGRIARGRSSKKIAQFPGS